VPTIAEDAQTSTAVAASGPGRGAALAASPPSSHPPASRAAGSGDGNDSPGNQRAEPPGRPDKRDGRAQRIGRAARTSPARASSIADGPRLAESLLAEEAAEHLDLGDVLELVGLRMVQLGPRRREAGASFRRTR
jgi:hypothetical protein